MSPTFEIEPFAAASLALLNDDERRDALTARGIRFIRRNGWLRWDGTDLAFAHDLASREYDRVTKRIAHRAGEAA